MSGAPTRAVVRRWSAWAADGLGGELATPEDWRRWARSPTPLARDGQPEIDFLPAGLRRRATRLTRLALRAAFDASEGEDRSALRSVFASRHGAIHVAVQILASIAREEAVSPLQFSHSVHNAQAGLFSIASGNRCASSSIAAGAETFAHGYLEALVHLQREDRPVLLVVADEPLPKNLEHLTEEPAAAYSMALLLARSGDGTALDLELSSPDPAAGPLASPPWPDAIEFLRFLAGEDDQLTLEAPARRWRWRRAAR